MSKITPDALRANFKKQIDRSSEYRSPRIDLFSWGEIANFSEIISEFTALESLRLMNTKVILEEPFDQLVNLKCLFLRSCGFQEIPEVVFKLKSLEELVIQYSEISEIPDDIKYLKKLKKLSLEKCQILTVPDTICTLENLEQLSLWVNQINYLPQCITELQNLYDLCLTGNQLEHIPTSIYELKKMKILMIDANKIMYFPKELLINLINLERLIIGRNPIANIPEGILNYVDRENNDHNVLPMLKQHFDIK
jgi:Leucine-rich repeat (LRR) protein